MELVNLYPELLLHIASYLSQEALLNLSLTCRHLRNATEPELYREYVHPHRKLGEEYNKREIRSFIFRLLDQPRLSQYVHHVELKSYSNLVHLDPIICPDSDREPVVCTEEEYDCLTQAAVAAGVIKEIMPYEEESSMRINRAHELAKPQSARVWYEYIYNRHVPINKIPYDLQFCKQICCGLEDPYVVLLMALVPNLRELKLHDTPIHPYALRWQAKHAFRNLRHFTALAHSEYNQSQADSFLQVSEVLLESWSNVLSGGNLETLEVLHATSGWNQEFRGEWDHQGTFTPSAPLGFCPGSAKITHLTLQMCTFSKQQMQNILDACSNLKYLYYSTCGLTLGPVNFTLPELVDLLQPYKASLEELHINLFDKRGYYDHLPSLPSLRDFTALKILDTNMGSWNNIFFGLEEGSDYFDDWMDNFVEQPLDEATVKLCDVLPPNITTLILVERDLPNMEPGCWDFRQLDHLLKNRQVSFPSLKVIDYVVQERSAKNWFPNPNLAFIVRSAERASSDDGFKFHVRSEVWHPWKYGTVFFNAKGAPKISSYSLEWKSDKYVYKDLYPDTPLREAMIKFDVADEEDMISSRLYGRGRGGLIRD